MVFDLLESFDPMAHFANSIPPTLTRFTACQKPLFCSITDHTKELAERVPSDSLTRIDEPERHLLIKNQPTEPELRQLAQGFDPRPSNMD
jgi:hypothetical protein